MENLFKNYFWVLTLFVLVIAAYFTATTANEFISDRLFTAPYEASTVKKSRAQETPPDILASRKASQPYASLLEARNVFDADRGDKPEPEPEKDPQPKNTTPTEPKGELEETELNLELVGTVVANSPDDSLASIRFEGTGKLVRIGSQLRRDADDEAFLAQVLEIHRRHMVVLEGGEKRRVSLWSDKKGKARTPHGKGKFEPQRPKPRTSKPDSKTDYSKGVRKVSMYKYEVDKAMLDEQLNDLSALGRQARIVPNYRNGKYQGFKLIGVRPGSLYRALGVRSGDIIQRVNGQEINSPNKAIQLFEELRNNRNIELDIERRGQKRTLTYDIK